MALGASMVENFITRVSMDGVERVTAGQKMLGAGFRSLKGDIGAMGAAAKSMKLDGMGMLAVGGAMTAAGAG